MKKTTFAFMALMQLGCSQEHYYYKDHTKVSLKVYEYGTKNSPTIDYYRNEKGILLGITDKIIVKVTNEKYLSQQIQEYHLYIVKKLSKNLYLFKVSDKSQTLNTANMLSKEKGIEYAHPDFIKKRIPR